MPQLRAQLNMTMPYLDVHKTWSFLVYFNQSSNHHADRKSRILPHDIIFCLLPYHFSSLCKKETHPAVKLNNLCTNHWELQRLYGMLNVQLAAQLMTTCH